MRKDLGKKLNFMPLPVLMIGTYDENGKANLMNAAWGGIYDFGEVFISLSPHKTTKNLELKKAFTLSFATQDTLVESDYFGLVSGDKEDKIKKAGFHPIKANHVDAPLFEEYPLSLECKVKSFEEGNLIGEIVSCNVDDKYLDKNGKIDVDKIGFISFDMVSNSYRAVGEKVGEAFKDGLKLRK